MILWPHVQGALLVIILIKRVCILKGQVEFNTLHHFVNTFGVFWDVWHFTGLPVSLKTCAYEIKGRLQRFQRHLTLIQVHVTYYCLTNSNPTKLLLCMHMIQSDYSVLLSQLKYKVHLCVNKWTHLGQRPTTNNHTNKGHDSWSWM